MPNELMRGLKPSHPGELLREDVLPALGRSKTAIAKLLGLSRQSLHDILAERQAVTPPVALRLAKLTGTSAELWLNLQQAHDLRIHAEALAEEIAAIPTLQPA